MGYSLIGEFFSILNTSLFESAAVLMVIGFLIWEIPRSVKIMDDEYTSGLYPEGGRVVDISLLIIGLVTMGFLFTGNLSHMISFLKKPGITAFFLIVMAVIPLILVLGFFKRFFPRFDGNSATVFMVQGFLDLMRTIFYISLSILVVPAIGYLVAG